MKDSIITVKQKKTEIKILIICFGLAFLLNIYSIIYYHTEWKELITMLPTLLGVTFVLYFILWLPRLIFYLIKKKKV